MLNSRLLPQVAANYGRRFTTLIRRRRPGIRRFQTIASPVSLAPISSFWLEHYDKSSFPQSKCQQQQQVRLMGRKSGASADDPKPRRWSKKQKKRHRRKMARLKELENHSPPGSKAGKRREFLAEKKKELVDEYRAKLDGSYYQKQLENSHPLNDPALEYTKEDALLDDLVGNSSNWTSQAAPQPIYYGDRQRAFQMRVLNQMRVYHEELQALPAGDPSPTHLLPNDKEIANALKAYRDQKGTRQKPVGIAKALHHVLKELGIPSTTAFGEYTYNALLSCCRTPKEGLRLFELMQQNRHDISEYSWAILVDIHAKVGDFEGCVRVLDEMKAEGFEANLPAYTSFLAACYKVCNDGRIAHSIRAKAGQVGWEKWQELFISGAELDVMSYGAILRLLAARGQPERCLNLLEEMVRFDIKPTTLCFSSALKAVAKSHETAIRFQRGWSRKNKRRERITAHHGKMARNIVLMAEAAQVELDDGFVSALQLCAAAAGDSATAKAIYLSYKVRQEMKHWRQIGGEDHLLRLQGKNPEQELALQRSPQTLQLSAGDGGSAVMQQQDKHNKPMSWSEREYGKDTRTLSAILRACAQAADNNGVGTMWNGRDNYGYLDAASLRLIQQYRQPSYSNTDIPGMTRLQAGLSTMAEFEEVQNPRKRTDPNLRRDARQKYQGVFTMDDVGTGLHELPDYLYEEFFDEDGMMKQKYIDTGLYPEYARAKENYEHLEAKELQKQIEAADAEHSQIEAGPAATNAQEAERTTEQTTQMYFCNEDRRWKMGTPEEHQKVPELVTTMDRNNRGQNNENLATNNHQREQIEWYFNQDTRKWNARPQTTIIDESSKNAAAPVTEVSLDESSDNGEELYFDDNARRWKSRPKPQQAEAKPEPKLTAYEAEALERARKLQGEYLELEDSDDGEEEEENTTIEGETNLEDFLKEEGEVAANALEGVDFETFFEQLKQEVEASGEDMTVDEDEARQLYAIMKNEFSESELKEALEQEVDDDDTVASEVEGNDDDIPTFARGRSPPKKDFEDIIEEIKEDWGDDGFDEDDWDEPQGSNAKAKGNNFMQQSSAAPTKKTPFRDTAVQVMERQIDATTASETQELPSFAMQPVESVLQSVNVDDALPETVDDDFELEELKQVLPGMPTSRLRKVREAYMDNLSDPSLLTLVPILRETMPDWLTTNTIRAANIRNAHFVMEKAEEAGLVDTHMLNGMVQFYTSLGALNSALEAYNQFEKHRLKPTEYSDRLVVQMFIEQRRLRRCLEFKQKVEERGRTLDLPSYGSMIDYCSKHDQLGSALLLLKECIAKHNSPPSENFLKQLRIICRHAGLEREVGLEDMIGKDPLEWLKHGEAVLKREKSKRGNRMIQHATNAATRA